MSAELRAAARGIQPERFQAYLRSRGWRLEEDLSDEQGIVLWAHDGLKLDVPLRTQLRDYERRMAEALAIVAEVEGLDPFALAGELLQPAGDTLAVRVDSEAARSGTLPLVDSIRLREATKNLLLASAHSAISPQAWFPRMSRAEATALLATVREVPNERGSFVARFVVPVEPAVGEQMDIEEDPFGRRVTKLLMRALDGVRRVRSLGAYDELLDMQGLGVSGNLLAALAAMRTAIGAGALELSVSWAHNRKPPPEEFRSHVRFSAEALDGLDAVAETMRRRAEAKGFELVGYVIRLDRGPDVGAPGEIVLLPTGEDADLRRVSIQLDAPSYEEAIAAHRLSVPVRVVGTLRKVGRRWVLADASGFERIADEADGIEGMGGERRAG